MITSSNLLHGSPSSVDGIADTALMDQQQGFALADKVQSTLVMANRREVE
jgi:hypothetical protein